MTENEVETITVTLESGDETDEITLPAGLVSLLADGDQSAVETVGDITLLSFASRAHHLVHHGQGADADAELSAELDTIEACAMDLFEDRFGMTYGEATGHQH